MQPSQLAAARSPSDRRNNFDALRLLAASAVIFSHAFLLATGQEAEEPLMRLTGGQAILGVVGVFVFFVISGYLVTQSWEATGSLPRFAAKRALRLYPALAACLLVLTFGLGPCLTSLATGDYLRDGGTLDFLVWNLLLHTDHNSLPGVRFTDLGIGTIVDGPLWSLPVEVAMYAMVAGLGLLRLIRLPVLAALLALGLVCIHFDTARYFEFIGSVGWMLGFFVAGMALYRLHGRAGIDNRLALLALAGLIASVPLGLFILMFPLCGGYLVIYLALHPRLPAIAAARFGDLSYGLYIYGWPVEQTVLYFRPGTSPLLLFVIAFPVTGALAFLSWHLLEKRALRLKPRRALEPTRQAQAL